MDTNLYSPTLDTADDAVAWVRSWTPVGGFPHPDDSAVVTNVVTGEPMLGIVGPAFPADLDLDLARAYDASKTKALDLLDAAHIDIYDLILDRVTVTVYVRLDFVSDADTGTFTTQDVKDALLARLDEVYAGQDDYPVTPEVTFIDGPDATI